jgi:nitrous oxidase accessory protein
VNRLRVSAALASLAIAAACSTAPRPIRAGEDRCAFCLMGLARERFATEVITRKGRIHTFDSIECLVRYLDADSADAVRSIWVTDYESPPRLLDVRKARFAQSEGIDSPMGLGVAAFASATARDALLDRSGGRSLDWDEVRDLVAAQWPVDARPAMEHSHSGPAIAAGRTPATPAVDADSGSAATKRAMRQDESGRLPTGSIADAVRLARPGDTLVIGPGIYREPVIVIDKPLHIVGEAGAILDGESKHGLIEIRADDVTVRNLVLRNVGTSYIDDRAAILVDHARRCRIENNRVENGFFGIYLARSDDCTIRDNRLTASTKRESASGNAIHLWYSTRALIENNTVRGYRDGIYFEFVKASTVRGNVSEQNLRYGLHFMFSDDCRYEWNIFRANGAGVAVMYTSGVEMTGNTFRENRGPATYGLLLKDIRDSRIRDNDFAGNSIALYVEGSDRLSVDGNTFTDNGWAVKLMANSEDNRFTANDFVANSFDVATNSIRNHSRFEGNYWDAYRGYDLDRDGSGDVAFRPVRLFSLLVERNAPSVLFMRSFLVQLLDAAESVIPSLTPETLVDAAPRMAPNHATDGDFARREAR